MAYMLSPENPVFTEEEISTETLSNLPQVTQQVKSRARNETQAVQL